MSQPISNQPPPSDNQSIQQAAAVNQPTDSTEKKQSPNAYLIAILTYLDSLNVMGNSLKVQTASASQIENSMSAANQMNSAFGNVQVISTKQGATLGQFTYATQHNQQIEQVRLVNNGNIQQMNTATSQILQNINTGGQNMAQAYSAVSGILDTYGNVAFAAALTTQPQ